MSDMNTPTPDGKAPRRWLGPAFLASVVVNVFLVALISVPLFFRPHDRGFGPPPDSHGPAMMHSAFKALPEEDRQVIRRAMKEQFREIVPHIRESQAARDALTEIQKAAKAVASLARAIERNPNSLLTGR